MCCCCCRLRLFHLTALCDDITVLAQPSVCTALLQSVQKASIREVAVVATADAILSCYTVRLALHSSDRVAASSIADAAMQLLRPRNEISIMHSQQNPLNLDYVMSCVASTDTIVFAGEWSVRRLQNNGLVKRHNVSDIHSADWHGHARCATLRDKAVLEFMQQNDASAVAQH
eukprot:6494-Heterococcus_DN1.PRE.1